MGCVVADWEEGGGGVSGESGGGRWEGGEGERSRESGEGGEGKRSMEWGRCGGSGWGKEREWGGK